MARNCSICSSPQADAVRAALMSGVSDAVVAAEYGFSRPAMQRHRQNHIVVPAQQVAALLGKGQDAVKERAVLASATAYDPRVWLALDAIAADLRRVQDRLDRAADQAAGAGQGMVLSSLSAQLLRGVEMRAKWGGIGQEKAQQGAQFRLTINIGGDSPVIIGDGLEFPHPTLEM